MSSIQPRRASQFQRAADGSMTLFEHLRELRGRLFKACLGIVVGALIGGFFAQHILDFLQQPYCSFEKAHSSVGCVFSASGGPISYFLLKLKVALYCGLILGAPVWLYQLWAFVAPGLHRRERRYTYIFAGIAAPLFFAGVILAHLVVTRSLRFFLGAGKDTLIISDVSAYFSFVTKMMLLFGLGFEFPLLVLMLNFTGMLTGRRLLGWWRQAIFLMFLFAAIVTPTPDPFSMSILAVCMGALYFGAVAVALVNDRRRNRRERIYADLDDDEISALDADDEEPITAGEPVTPGAFDYAPEPIAGPAPIERRYDDFT